VSVEKRHQLRGRHAGKVYCIHFKSPRKILIKRGLLQPAGAACARTREPA